MECSLRLLPLPPGKMEAYKAFAAEASGPRAAEHHASRQRMGVAREVTSVVQIPQGDFLCIFIEGEDLDRAFDLIATSDDPHDQWFRTHAAGLLGLTPETLQIPPATPAHFDYRSSGS